MIGTPNTDDDHLGPQLEYSARRMLTQPDKELQVALYKKCWCYAVVDLHTGEVSAHQHLGHEEHSEPRLDFFERQAEIE